MVTVASQSPVPRSRPGRAATTLAVATVGLGLNLRAWMLMGPHLRARFDVRPGQFVVLVGLPLLVAAVVRLPVGVLTDRYGARVMFPAVSLAAAAAVSGMALADSLPVAVVAGSAAGVGGGAFVVGGALVSRTFRYGRRGLALGAFSLGTVVAVAVSAVCWRVDSGGRRTALVLAGLLVVFAGLAALVLRDRVAAGSAGSPVRRCLEMIRLASTSSLSLLYAVALGGLVASAAFLPLYLTAVVGVGRFQALAVTAVTVMLAAVARLAGAWWTDRRPTARLLLVCYAVAAGLCLVMAVDPRRWWLTAPVISAMAVCDGLAGGALLALIGKAARPGSVGAVMGAIGAASALGALLPPALLAGVDRLSHSYSAAWILLAAVMLAVALYARVNGLRIGLGLAVRFDTEPSPTAMTVALVGASDTRLGAAAVVSRLAELAASDELVVVYGSDEPVSPQPNANVLVTGLRDRLPRHSVMTVNVDPRTGALRRLAAPLGEAVDAGTVAIAVTPTADLGGVVAELSSYLHADRVLKVSYTLAAGADLHEIWKRRSPAANAG
jgi:MFS transporter, NNP family, nitrate/nitrite transporter